MSGVPLPEGVDAAAVGPVCGVTGAAGYVGTWLVPTLRALGCEVRGLDVAGPPSDPGVRWVQADVRDREALAGITAGADTVFHLAAMIGSPGLSARAARARTLDVNVGGTLAVIDACREQGVARLVYVSSNNVCVDGDRVEQDESAPYAARIWDPYTESKIAAEKAVLAADSPGLRTCALRPGGIWGPGEGGYMLQEFLRRLAAGDLTALLGSPESVGDNTHVFNLVRALLQASAALARRPDLGGRAWFITDDERINPIAWFRPVADHLGVPWPTRRVPARLAWALATVGDAVRALGGPMPPLTRGEVLKIVSSTSFRIDAARRDLGYAPIVRHADGMAAAMPDLERIYRGHRRA